MGGGLQLRILAVGEAARCEAALATAHPPALDDQSSSPRSHASQLGQDAASTKSYGIVVRAYLSDVSDRFTVPLSIGAGCNAYGVLTLSQVVGPPATFGLEILRFA